MQKNNKLVINSIRFLTFVENAVIRIISIILFSYRKGKSNNILIFTVGGLGDFITTIPAIKKIREIYVNSKITLLCVDSTIIEISRRSPTHPEWFDFVNHLIDDKKFVKGESITTKSSISCVRNYIKNNKYDIAFILDPLGAGLLNKLKKIIYLRIVGIANNVYGTRVYFDFNIKCLRNIYHAMGLIKNTVWGSLSAVYEHAHLSEEFPGYSIYIDMKKISDEVSRLATEKFIIIFPGGGFPFKLWPIEKYVELINRLSRKDKNLKFYLIGKGKDAYECENIEKYIMNSIIGNLCNKLNLMETAYLIKEAKLFIGNDSGPSHLSTALGTQTIIIEHAQDYPGYWCPYGDNAHPIRLTPKCQYCRTYPVCPTGTLECIKNIEVTAVESIIDKILKFN